MMRETGLGAGWLQRSKNLKKGFWVLSEEVDVEYCLWVGQPQVLNLGIESILGSKVGDPRAYAYASSRHKGYIPS